MIKGYLECLNKYFLLFKRKNNHTNQNRKKKNKKVGAK